MNEGNPGTVGSITGDGIDHAGAILHELFNGSLDVLYFVGDMVDSWTVLYKKPGNWAVIPRRLQKFDLRFTYVEKGNPDLLLCHLLDAFEAHAKAVPVKRDRLVERPDRNADVIYFFKHHEPLFQRR